MKILPQLSVEHALAGRGWGMPESPPLALEQEFTETHRRLEQAHPYDRETACLRVLFPRILQPIEADDVLAGRILYPLTAFSPEPAGLGYSAQCEALQTMARSQSLGEPTSATARALLAYWEPRTTAARVRAAYPPELASRIPSDAWTSDSGAGFPLYRIAGTVLDFGKLVGLGLPGLRAAVQTRLAQTSQPEPAHFYRSCGEALDLLAASLDHYAAQALSLAADGPDPEMNRRLSRIADSCRHLLGHPPRTLHQAAQLLWLYALLAGTWNYGRLDDILGPYLDRDLAEGQLTEESAIALLSGWWRLMKAYENQYNHRVFLGGRGRTHERAADHFALLAMEATRRVRLNQPQVSLRFYQGQNPALMDKALELIGQGCTFPILYNDDRNLPSVARAFAVSAEEAAQYTPYGCGEYVLAHRSLGTPNGVMNLAKCLELALHDGIDPLTGRKAGPSTGDPSGWTSFSQLWQAYTQQTEWMITALAEQEAIAYQVAGQEAPFLFLSLLYDDCLKRGRPLLSGGVRYLGGTLETYGNTNAADSLFAIEELVFRQKACSLPELVATLEANFSGQHGFLRRCLLALPKYGNDHDGADAMAIRVHEHVCHFTRDQAARVGLHSYLVVIINNWANVIFGRTTAASADGRLAGEALANGNNPSPGRDRQGTTAFLNSLVKLDPALHAGAVQNMKFSPDLFGRHRAKLDALLRGYWQSGGTQAMITVVSAGDLQEAMREPGQWGHLMVRVGGFSARFVDLPQDAQEELLRRTLHG